MPYFTYLRFVTALKDKYILGEKLLLWLVTYKSVWFWTQPFSVLRLQLVH